MTRINLIHPRELDPRHLVAEYKELPRVFGLVRRAVERGESPETIIAPPAYTLGKGHVLFFYDKLLWLSWRHLHLVNEMVHRGFQVNFKENLRVTHRDIPTEWWNDWVPKQVDIDASRHRIEERLAAMPRRPYASR